MTDISVNELVIMEREHDAAVFVASIISDNKFKCHTPYESIAYVIGSIYI